MILADRVEPNTQISGRKLLSWRDLMTLPQTWGTIIARSFTDPVWFFVTDWFPIYLVAKGIELKTGLIAIWIPFLTAECPEISSVGASPVILIERRMALGGERAKLLFVIFGGVGVNVLIPTIFTTNVYLTAFLFALATFAYASFSTIANVFSLRPFL